MTAHTDGHYANLINQEAVITLSDGRVELSDFESIKTSPLFNEDLGPVPVVKRAWTTYNFAALWIGMSASIPTYMLSSGLIASGMNWWQALITILLGNTIVLIPILLNSHPGTKYGIPFPVFARASYGTIGSNLPALMRAVVACGWFGIQAWIGGQAVNTLLSTIPGWTAMTSQLLAGYSMGQWISFGLFWLLNIYIIFSGMDLLRKVSACAAPFVLVMTILLAVWAVNQAHGLGYLMHQPGKFRTLAELLPVFIPSVTAMIGFWATLSLNMPDFTRFSRSQREQVIGQMAALPTTMTIFAAMGVIITSAAVVLYPAAPVQELWDPVKLIGHFDQIWLVAMSMFTICVATLSVNIAANVVSPANDFANAFPKWISFKTGGLITGIVGLLMQPWKLVADPNGYIFSWLLGYSGGLGSIAGVLITDYWLIRRKQLCLPDLYTNHGRYYYSGGWNRHALTATICGCAMAWIGLIYAPLKPLYDYAWFVGLGVSATLYWLLMTFLPPKSQPSRLGSHA
jgi:nucleobase:cation symporter-1, NCS1 family